MLAISDSHTLTGHDMPGPAVPVKLREYKARDAAALRQCVVALQELERLIDANLGPGEKMADVYCAKLHKRCREASGQIFVAEHDDEVVGFAAVLAREPFIELDDPPGTYALVIDLVILATHRGKGIGRRLLDRAEAYARDAGATEIRVGVLAKNTAARRSTWEETSLRIWRCLRNGCGEKAGYEDGAGV